jgi:hypothetical protein
MSDTQEIQNAETNAQGGAKPYADSLLHKSAVHKNKFKKNLIVLAMIFGLCALIWGVTIVKMS